MLCEDTRETRKIMEKYAISTPTMSYHAQSKLAKVDKIFELLAEGKNLALVSDAGTPTISDPGAMLVSKIKEKFILPPRASLAYGGSRVEGLAVWDWALTRLIVGI